MAWFNGPPMMNGNGFNGPPMMNGNGFNAPPMMNGNGFSGPPMMNGNGFNAPPMMNGNGFSGAPMMNGNGFNAPPMMNGNDVNAPPIMIIDQYGMKRKFEGYGSDAYGGYGGPTANWNGQAAKPPLPAGNSYGQAPAPPVPSAPTPSAPTPSAASQTQPLQGEAYSEALLNLVKPKVPVPAAAPPAEPAEPAASDPSKKKALSQWEKEELFAKNRDANPEATREAKPLELLKERAPQLQWETVIDNPHLRSWAFIAREPAITWNDFGVLKNQLNWLELKSQWGERTTRKVCWLTRKGCTCPYEYGAESCPATHFPDWFDEMTQRWLGKLRLQDTEQGMPNCANINLYEDGEQAVSWHADDEPLFKGTVQDTRIISVSLGAARKFQIGLRTAKKSAYQNVEKGSTESAWLEHGHLGTMEGMMQKHYLHQVAKGAASTEPRINVTFRYNVCHKAGCQYGPPAPKQMAVRWISLPPAVPFMKRGLAPGAPAVQDCEDLKRTGLASSASSILSEILRGDVQGVEWVHDTNWDTVPEIGRAFQEAAGEEVSFSVAIHPGRGVWGVGFATKWKSRESTAKLALCLALLPSTQGATNIMNKYPGLAKLRKESGVDTGGGEKSTSTDKGSDKGGKGDGKSEAVPANPTTSPSGATNSSTPPVMPPSGDSWNNASSTANSCGGSWNNGNGTANSWGDTWNNAKNNANSWGDNWNNAKNSANSWGDNWNNAKSNANSWGDNWNNAKTNANGWGDNWNNANSTANGWGDNWNNANSTANSWGDSNGNESDKSSSPTNRITVSAGGPAPVLVKPPQQGTGVVVRPPKRMREE